MPRRRLGGPAIVDADEGGRQSSGSSTVMVGRPRASAASRRGSPVGVEKTMKPSTAAPRTTRLPSSRVGDVGIRSIRAPEFSSALATPRRNRTAASWCVRKAIGEDQPKRPGPTGTQPPRCGIGPPIAEPCGRPENAVARPLGDEVRPIEGIGRCAKRDGPCAGAGSSAAWSPASGASADRRVARRRSHSAPPQAARWRGGAARGPAPQGQPDEMPARHQPIGIPSRPPAGSDRTSPHPPFADVRVADAGAGVNGLGWRLSSQAARAAPRKGPEIS